MFFVFQLLTFPLCAIPYLGWGQLFVRQCDTSCHRTVPASNNLKTEKKNPSVSWVITCIAFQSSLLNSHSNSSLFTNTEETIWERNQNVNGKESGCCLCHHFCWKACQVNPMKNLTLDNVGLFSYIYKYIFSVVFLVPLAWHYNSALENLKKLWEEYSNWLLKNKNTRFFSCVLCVHMHFHNWSFILSELTFFSRRKYPF